MYFCMRTQERPVVKLSVKVIYEHVHAHTRRDLRMQVRLQQVLLCMSEIRRERVSARVRARSE